MTVISAATDIIPSPPTCIITSIAACPNGDQYVAVSLTTSPVTHTADVAVNSASLKEALPSSTVDTGSIKTSVPKMINPAKPIIMI